MTQNASRRLVTQADYARHRKVSRQYVGRLAAKGILSTADGLVDVEESDATLRAISDPLKAAIRKHKDLGGSGPQPQEVRREPASDPEQKPPSLHDRLLLARIKTEEEEGRIREQKRRERDGELVERAAIDRLVFDRASAEKEALLNWPARNAANIAVELGVPERKVFDVLDRYMRRHLAERSSVVVAAESDSSEEEDE